MPECVAFSRSAADSVLHPRFRSRPRAATGDLAPFAGSHTISGLVSCDDILVLEEIDDLLIVLGEQHLHDDTHNSDHRDRHDHDHDDDHDHDHDDRANLAAEKEMEEEEPTRDGIGSAATGGRREWTSLQINEFGGTFAGGSYSMIFSSAHSRFE